MRKNLLHPKLQRFALIIEAASITSISSSSSGSKAALNLSAVEQLRVVQTFEGAFPQINAVFHSKFKEL
jgi:hypothetical protein